MFLFRSKKDQTLQSRRKRRLEGAQGKSGVSFAGVLPSVILVLFFILVVTICFVGQSPAGPQIVLNQIAKMRVVSDFPFSYTSALKTKRLQEKQRQMVAPVYSINMEPYTAFAATVGDLESRLNALALQVEHETPNVAIARTLPQMNAALDLNLSTEDVAALLSVSDAVRSQLLAESLHALGDVFSRGIYSPTYISGGKDSGSFFLNVAVKGSTQLRYQTEEEALRFLRLHLSVLDPNPKITQALVYLFKNALQPNLVYDALGTQDRMDAAMQNVEPVQMFIEKGQVIIHPGTLVTDEDYEQWLAYRLKSKSREDNELGLNTFLLQRILATLVIILSTVFYIKVALPHFRSSKRYRILPALIILMNLLLGRFVLELGESEWMQHSPFWMIILPHTTPLLLAPILTALLIGSTPAILVAILVCAFQTLLQATSLTYFFIYTFTSFITIYLARNTRQLNRLLLAGMAGGVILGVCTGLANWLELAETHFFASQIICATLTGLISALVANSLRPPLEKLFGITTDFTLLELTDFNHPLLRRLQVEAPGTYHHSLMVAHLAERAALEIEANSLLCRTAALYHDIGKLVKPEYFVENQRASHNPHDERNPSISAIVIKSHVKEGVELAREYGLPRPIIDAIQQHHGTTLVQYFYAKALRLAQEDASLSAEQAAASIDEGTFRYEGPKPNTKEMAILFFADCVEAASRSLKKFSHQNIVDLVTALFEERLSEHQLDESPLTMADISQIKESFIFSLVNMLHSRIDYQPMTVNNPQASLPEPFNKKPHHG